MDQFSLKITIDSLEVLTVTVVRFGKPNTITVYPNTKNYLMVKKWFEHMPIITFKGLEAPIITEALIKSIQF